MLDQGNGLNKIDQLKLESEDLFATRTVETTVDEIKMDADDWLEQAAEKVSAVEGDTYVKLDRGLLTVDQLNCFFASMPLELTYTDHNNQFLYYNYTLEPEEMLASKRPEQVGKPLGEGHSEQSLKAVEWVVQQLRSSQTDAVRVHVPVSDPNKFVVHNYQAIKDEVGNYVGVNDYTYDLQPLIDWYLEQTDQKLVGGVDAVSSASVKIKEVDAVTSASMKE